MFKNIERKQKFIDDKQRALDGIERQKEKKNKHHFSDLLADSTEHMFSSQFMDSILKQDKELEVVRKQREINERFVKVVQEFASQEASIDKMDRSGITAEISMSEMDNKENSDLSLIKSEYTQDMEASPQKDSSVTGPIQKNPAEKRKVNVFEYNNLANNNKKMRLINLNKPLQRTDIIHLENSLDFDKNTPNQKKKNNKNTVMMSQKFLKSNKFQPQQLSKKISLKSLKISDNDDRKTFISSTDRHMDTTSNKSKRQSSKPKFKVKRIHKRVESTLKSPKKVSTPKKESGKSAEANIIITRRNDSQKVVNKRKKIIFDQKSLSRPKDKNGRFVSHERKVTEVWTGKDVNPLPMYLSKQLPSSTSTPLMVCNGANGVHRHHKSKDAFIGPEHKLQSQKSYK